MGLNVKYRDGLRKACESGKVHIARVVMYGQKENECSKGIIPMSRQVKWKGCLITKLKQSLARQ